MKQPFLFIVLTYIAGLLLGRVYFIPVWYLTVCALLVIAGAAYFYSADKKEISSVLIFILIGLTGVLRANINQENLSQISSALKSVYTQPVTVSGTIASEPITRSNHVRFETRNNLIKFEDTQILLRGEIRLYFSNKAALFFEDNPPSIGDHITVSCVLNDFMEPSTQGLFNFKEYMNRHDVYAMGYLNSKRNVLQFEKHDVFFDDVLGLKHRIEKYFYSNMKEQDASLLLAMLFGQKTRLSEQQKDKFIRCGIMHIFAVSGLHVGLAITLIFFTLRLLRCNNKLSSILTILFIVLYMTLTGFRPSVMRAGIVGICYLVSRMIKREGNSLNLLSFAAFALLAYDPRLLGTAGFQLSFVAVLGILLITPKIKKILNIPSRYLSDFIAAALAVQIALLPLTVYYFNVMSLAGYLSNIIVIPLVFLIIYTSIFSLMTGFLIPFAGALFNSFNSLLLMAIMWTSDFFSSFRLSAIYFPDLPIFAIVLYYSAILLFVYFENKKPGNERQTAQRFLLLFGTIIIILATTVFVVGTSSELEISFLDVSQGDSALIQFPDGKTMLVDGGPGKNGKYVILPLLKEKGINRIDCMVLTHPDYDHLSGLVNVVESIDVGLCIYNGAEHNSATYRKFLDLIDQKRIPIREVRRDDRLLNFGNTSIYVLHPDEEHFSRYSSNDKSVVFRLTYKDFNVLMTGDVEERGERSILADGYNLESDVLKVGHHGSASSSSRKFIYAVNPSIGIISVGRKNRYGHPAGAVLNRLAEEEVTVYRTDQHGTITISTDGYHIRPAVTMGLIDGTN